MTVNRLKEIASLLINLHAQHEQQTLLKPAKHLELLDRFGGDKLLKKKQVVQEDFRVYQALNKERSQDGMDEAQRNKRLDFLQYQIQEIRDAKLVVGEDEELEHQYKKAVNSKEILECANTAYELTGYAADSAAEQIGRAVREMRRLAELDRYCGTSAGCRWTAGGFQPGNQ